MTLQQKTLHRYRQLFPHETLRETSARTSIQITRVFRLFNGKKMKVEELEAFVSILNQKKAENASVCRLSHVVEEASTSLSNEELAKMAEYVARRIAIQNLTKTHIKSEYQIGHIA